MKIKVKAPGELSDIKLSQYQRFIKATKNSTEYDDEGNITKQDSALIKRQMVECFCNLPYDVVRNIKSKDFNGLVNHITKVLEQQSELKLIIKHEGESYGFIPSLEDITLGEQYDLETFLENFDTMDKAMGVMYRPITIRKGEKYQIEDYKGEGKSLDLTMDIVNGATAFFLTLLNDCRNCTLNFIEGEVQRPQNKEILMQNGVDIAHFTDLLKETLGGSLKSAS